MKNLLTILLLTLVVVSVTAQTPERIPVPTGSAHIELIAEGTRMYYACAFDAIYRNESVTTPWTRCAEIPGAAGITPLYVSADTIIASVLVRTGLASKRVLFVSSDKGATWLQAHEVPASFSVAGFANGITVYADTCDYYGSELVFTLVDILGSTTRQINVALPCENYAYSWMHSADSLFVSANGVAAFAISVDAADALGWTLKSIPNVKNIFNCSRGNVGFLFDSTMIVRTQTTEVEYVLPFKTSELGVMEDFVVWNDTSYFPFKNGIVRLPLHGTFSFVINLGKTPAERCYGIDSQGSLMVFLQGPSLARCATKNGSITAWNDGLFGPGGKSIAGANNVLLHAGDWLGLQRVVARWDANATKPLSINRVPNISNTEKIFSVGDEFWLLGDGAWKYDLPSNTIVSQIESSREVHGVDKDGPRTYLWRADAVMQRANDAAAWQAITISGDYFDMAVKNDSIHMLRFEFGPAPLQVQIINTVFDPEGFALAELRVVTSDIADGRYLGTTKTRDGLLINLSTSLRKSTDGGLTWVQIFTPYRFSGKISSADSVLCVWCSDQVRQGVCISGNNGNTWVMQPVEVDHNTEVLATFASDSYFTFSTWSGLFRVPRTVTSVFNDEQHHEHADHAAENNSNYSEAYGAFRELTVVDVTGREVCTSQIDLPFPQIKSHIVNGFFIVLRRFERTTATSLLFNIR
ncbi:MAG: hypothetical protein HQ472_03780 [Ignavibacteria bacterium]|nr:hypothetical protein [Ignavibacteria bacterium]